MLKKKRFFLYIGAKGAFRKILGSVGQKWVSEKVSKGDGRGSNPFGSAGGRIPEGGGGGVLTGLGVLTGTSPPPP